MDPEPVIDIAEHVACIRKRPAMYVGETGSRGIEHLVNELVSNCIDHFLCGGCSEVSVSLTDELITVSDDGLGMPPVNADPLSVSCHFQAFHNTASVDNHAPHVHLFSVGAGLIAVNALSETLTVKTGIADRVVKLSFSRGALISKSNEPNESGWRGTEIGFRPDPDIFQDSRVRQIAVRQMLFDAVHLFPGLFIRFDRERFHAPEGLAAYAALLDKSWHPPIISMRERVGDVEVDVALAGCSDSQCQFLSWANGAFTPEHGSHVDALRRAILTGTPNDYGPALGMIHVVMYSPEFAGPTRGKLVAPHIVDPIYERIQAQLAKVQ